MLTKKDFIDSKMDKRVLNPLRNAVIINVIAAGISIVLCAVLNYWVGLIDVFVSLPLILWTYLNKSKVCAVIYLVYACISSLIALLSYGHLGGWLYILCGIMAISAFKGIDRAYEAYCMEENHRAEMNMRNSVNTNAQ